MVLAPWVVHSVYSFLTKNERERNTTNLLVIPILVWRMLHSHIWISLARYQTAKSKHRILDKGIEFEQVDRERNWLVFLFYICCCSCFLVSIIIFSCILFHLWDLKNEWQGWPDPSEWYFILHRAYDSSRDFKIASMEMEWCDYHHSPSYGTSGIPLLLVSQRIAPSFPLLSLPFPPSFIYRYRAHYM